jgi:hypothetical protein
MRCGAPWRVRAPYGWKFHNSAMARKASLALSCVPCRYRIAYRYRSGWFISRSTAFDVRCASGNPKAGTKRYRFAYWSLTELSTRPLSKAPDALAKLCPCRRVVDVPGPVGHFSPQRPVLRAAIPEHEHRMQKAQDHGDGPKDLLPGQLRRLPSIGADRLGRVVLVQEPSLGGEHAVGLLERVGRCALGQLSAENASACGRRGDIDLIALEPRVLLVGDQVIGEVGGALIGVPTTEGRPKVHQARYPYIGSRPKT